MLGAQARAAELQAAKSAAMRQRAHREAQELLLPPESAPVSLTDFARNPLTSKNKGTKAFRPLTDLDFESSGSQTESSITEMMGSCTARTQRDSSDKTPIAPRAMLARSDSDLSKITLPNIRAPTFTPRSHTNSTSMQDLEQYHVCTSPYPDETQNVSNYVFGPDDLTPIKQEVKLADMRNHYLRPHTANLQSHHTTTPFASDARAYAALQRHPYDDYFSFPDMHARITVNPYIPSRPPMAHYTSEINESTTGCAATQLHVDLTKSFADDLVDHHHRIRQQPRMDAVSKMSKSLLDHDQPYDRNSKMQSFVAAQQAMARKGKTVLHNPDLYRSPLTLSATMSKPQTCTSTTPSPSQSHVDPYMSNMVEPAKFSNLHGLCKPNNEETTLQAGSKSCHDGQEATTMVTSQAITNSGLDEQSLSDDLRSPWSGETMAEEWHLLRPIGVKDREKMLYSIRHLTARESSTYGSVTRLNSDIHSTSYYASLGARTKLQFSRRLEAIRIVEEYEKQKDQSTFGVIGRPMSKDKSTLSTRGCLKAVANILASLHDPTDMQGSDKSLNHYTPPPESAIDEIVTRKPLESSLFDDLSFVISKPATNNL